jgi:hypothetical protein
MVPCRPFRTFFERGVLQGFREGWRLQPVPQTPRTSRKTVYLGVLHDHIGDNNTPAISSAGDGEQRVRARHVLGATGGDGLTLTAKCRSRKVPSTRAGIGGGSGAEYVVRCSCGWRAWNQPVGVPLQARHDVRGFATVRRCAKRRRAVLRRKGQSICREVHARRRA